ncbi:MAG TPA: PH domain-containing protein [Candidatus Saccharimonadales bacterium]|nr:PH domain-containing protein [Candidatus Saccharimonadales bacterium]
MNPDQNAPQPPQSNENPYNNPLRVMSPGERELGEIRRHPFGLFGVYFGAAVIIILVGVGAALLPSFAPSLSVATRNLAYIIAVFVAIFVLIFTYIAAVIYHGNRWILTSDSITQISQVSLFRKQTSQLSLANLEDVTFDQNGLIPTMFGFGTLKVETAGERSKFQFPFCPNPSKYARDIIQAHEEFIQSHPEEGVTVRPGSFPQTAYQQPYQQQYQAPPQPEQQYQPPANPVPSEPQQNDEQQQGQ